MPSKRWAHICTYAARGHRVKLGSFEPLRISETPNPRHDGTSSLSLSQSTSEKGGKKATAKTRPLTHTGNWTHGGYRDRGRERSDWEVLLNGFLYKYHLGIPR